jgi:hypothetical protein
LNQYDFNLEITPLQNERIEFTHVLVGKKVVFTGKMNGYTKISLNKQDLSRFSQFPMPNLVMPKAAKKRQSSICSVIDLWRSAIKFSLVY